MYDPLLITSLFAQMFVECPLTTALGWVSLFIRCLSSKDANVREIAAYQLALVLDGIPVSFCILIPLITSSEVGDARKVMDAVHFPSP